MPSVEDLNPRSRLVKDLEMTARRAISVEKLCARHVELCRRYGLDPRSENPISWGSIDTKPGGPVNPHKLVNEVGEQDVRLYWRELYTAWHTGSLRRQIDDMLANLPESVRTSKHFKDYL